MKNNGQKIKLVLSVFLFIGFLVMFVMNLTGLSLHQWLGMSIYLAAILHLVLHWKWVMEVTKRFFGGTSWRARLYYALDGLIMVGFCMIIWTGLVISTWFDLAITDYLVWKDIHVVSSVITLFLVINKVILHWRWIAKAVRQFRIFRLETNINPTPATPSMSRADFLKIMGAAGIASLISVRSIMNLVQRQSNDVTATGNDALTNQVASLPSESIMTRPTTLPTATSPTMIDPTATPQVVPTSCTVSCPNHCSFPGRCRKYQDTNGNNLCDFGECI